MVDRDTRTMINDPGFRSGSSPWYELSEEITGRAGEALQIIGSGARAVANVAGNETQAARFGGQAAGFERQGAWDETTLISTALQNDIIGAQTVQAKIDAHDKWLWRRGAARARYAAGNIAVDVGSPLAVTASLLEAQAEEISLINLNQSIRKWNEVELPAARARAEMAKAEHQADMAEIDAEGFRQAARVSKTAGILNVAAQAADFIGGFS